MKWRRIVKQMNFLGISLKLTTCRVYAEKLARSQSQLALTVVENLLRSFQYMVQAITTFKKPKRPYSKILVCVEISVIVFSG